MSLRWDPDMQMYYDDNSGDYSDPPNGEIVDPQTGRPPVGGGLDPWGQSPGDPSYGYPPGTDPYWDRPGTPPKPTPPPPTPTDPYHPSGGGGFNESGPGLPNLSQFASPDPLKPWTGTFTAPTASDVANTPGFQFELGQGVNALQRSAAAKGTLLTGGTLKATDQYATNFANTKYQDAYNNARNTYESNRTDFLTNEANRYQSQFANNAQQWGIASGYFGMGEAKQLQDFNIFDSNRNFDFNTFNSNRNFNQSLNSDYWTHMLQLMAAGRPPTSTV